MSEDSSPPVPYESKSQEQLIREIAELRSLYEAEKERSRDLFNENMRLKSAEPSKNQEFFRLFFENMSEGFALGEPLLDENGRPYDFRFTMANKAFEKHSGLSREDLGKPITQVLPQVERSWIETYTQVALSGKTIEFENYNQDLDRYFDVYCYSPFCGRFAILFTDVTKHKRAEEKLQQAHGLIRGITEGTEDMIAAEDHDFQFLFFNDAYRREFKKLWGKDLEVGTSMIEAMAPWPENLQKAKALWSRAFNGESFQITMEFGPSDTEKQFYDLRFNPVHDSSGKQIGAAHILRNVTEAMKIREALRESETKFRTIFQMAAVGICRVSLKDARMIEINDSFRNMLGYSREELQRTPWPQITHPDDINLDLIPFRQMSAGELEIYTVEKRYIHKNGHHVWARLTLSLVRDVKGKPDYQIAIVENITEKKMAEEERERLISELEASNRELEGFTYSVSHDLRAPIRHMNSFAELLKRDAWPVLSGKSRSFLSNIQNASEKMSTLADELLQFSRMGSIELEETLVNLNTVINEVLQNFAADIKDRDVQWQISYLPKLRGDAAMLQLVFLNLIDNALKFTRSRSTAVIEIGYMAEEDYIIYIRDNGIGFEMQYHDKLFGIFQRLHAIEKIEGTGIGLANVARIVQRHGGRVWAKGKTNEGAVFYLAFPRAKMS